MPADPEGHPTPASSSGPTGGQDAARRDADLAEREAAAEHRAEAGGDEASRAAAEARGLDAQRESEELDRQAEAAIDALGKGAPK